MSRRVLDGQLPVLWSSGALLLMMAVFARAQSDGRAIINRAIEAAGGAHELEKFRAVHARYEGSGYFGATKVPCRLESFLNWPIQLRTNLECESADRKKFLLVQVFDGEQAWRSENGQTQQAEGATLAELRESFYFSTR